MTHLVVVNSYSKWPEVIPLKSTTPAKISLLSIGSLQPMAFLKRSPRETARNSHPTNFRSSAYNGRSSTSEYLRTHLNRTDRTRVSSICSNERFLKRRMKGRQKKHSKTAHLALGEQSPAEVPVGRKNRTIHGTMLRSRNSTRTSETKP